MSYGSTGKSVPPSWTPERTLRIFDNEGIGLGVRVLLLLLLCGSDAHIFFRRDFALTLELSSDTRAPRPLLRAAFRLHGGCNYRPIQIAGDGSICAPSVLRFTRERGRIPIRSRNLACLSHFGEGPWQSFLTACHCVCGALVLIALYVHYTRYFDAR